MPKTSENLSPVKIRARKRASLAIIEGKTYKQIAHEMGSTAKPGYEAQTVYSCLQTKSGQEAIKAIAEQYYDKAKLRRLLDEMLDSKKTPAGVKVRAIELGMRSEAMLTDKQVQDRTVREEKDLSQYTPDELHKALLDKIRDSQDAA